MTLSSKDHYSWYQFQHKKKEFDKKSEALMELEKEKYRYKLEKEQEYLNDLKVKMEEELRAQHKWDSLKAARLMTGQWALVTATATQSEIVVWCIDNMPEGSWIPSSTSFRSKEWLILKGDQLTAFTLRWA